MRFASQTNFCMRELCDSPGHRIRSRSGKMEGRPETRKEFGPAWTWKGHTSVGRNHVLSIPTGLRLLQGQNIPAPGGADCDASEC